MFKNQLNINIEELDLKIGKLSKRLEELEDDDVDNYDAIMVKIEKLTDLRCKLAESKVNGSVKPVVVSSLLGIASLVIVLRYEEKDVITSKAISMIPSMFNRGSK